MSHTLDHSVDKEFLEKEVSEVVPGADQWRWTPNEQLGGKMPEELINGTAEEREQLHHLLGAIKHGMVS